jgi:hypothetical protein
VLVLCYFCLQYGGGPSQRLSAEDCPLALQDTFLERLGYTTAVRRTRLGIDPELRHLLRFHTGPAAPHPGLKGFSKCGAVLVLKGLVFPHWRRRPIALLHSRLFLYPGNPERHLCISKWRTDSGNRIRDGCGGHGFYVQILLFFAILHINM